MSANLEGFEGATSGFSAACRVSASGGSYRGAPGVLDFRISFAEDRSACYGVRQTAHETFLADDQGLHEPRLWRQLSSGDASVIDLISEKMAGLYLAGPLGRRCSNLSDLHSALAFAKAVRHGSYL